MDCLIMTPSGSFVQILKKPEKSQKKHEKVLAFPGIHDILSFHYASKTRRSASFLSVCRVAYVAQLVERILGKDEVPGSIPGVGSTFPRMIQLNL